MVVETEFSALSGEILDFLQSVPGQLWFLYGHTNAVV